MKKHTVFQATVLALFAFSTFSMPVGAADLNLLTDPGFETGVSGFFAQNATDSAVRSTTAPINGTGSLKVTINGYGNNAWWAFPTSAKASQFEVSGKVRGDTVRSASTMQLCAAAYYAGSGSIVQNCVDLSKTVGQVNTMTATLPLDNTRTLSQVAIRVTLNGTGPVSYSFDDVSAIMTTGTPPPDATPPLVSVTAPSNGASLSPGTVSVTAAATDNIAVAGVQFLVDGANLGAEDTTSPYGVSWNATNGSHTLAARARDTSGNTTTSSPVSVTVSSTDVPTGTVSVGGGALTTGTTAVTLSLSATDSGSTVTAMRFSNDGLTFTAPEAYATSKAWTITTGDGTKTVRAQFQNALGNWSAVASDDIILDTTAPTVPTNLHSTGMSSNGIGLAWNASTDTNGGVSYRIYRDGVSVGSTAALLFIDAGLTPSTSYQYRVAAFDAVNNLSAPSAPITAVTAAPSASLYPLRVSADGRQLIDQNGSPFLIQGDAAWSLIASLSDADADAYLANRQQKGFNAVLVNLIEHKYVQNAPADFYGDQPFTTPGDFSTPNEAYFAHADHVIQDAASKGIMVLLFPAYNGFGGGSEGWYQEMQANGTAKLTTYGQYLGNRYRNYPNILWVEGGDYNPTTHRYVNAVANGILANDPNHLHSAHCDRGLSASDCYGNEPWLKVNATYTNYVTYDQALRDYNRTPVRPSFLIESVYENEGSTTPTVIRAEAYRSILSGSEGHVFGNNPIWEFDGPKLYPAPYNWQTGMNGQGSQDMARLWTLLDARDWSHLVPDQTHAVVTAGFGTYTTDQSNVSNNYATTARSSNGKLVMTYMPSRRTITVNMAQLAGPVTARWYDPTNGSFTTISGSPFANTGSRTFTPAGNNAAGAGDWVLVLETP